MFFSVSIAFLASYAAAREQALGKAGKKNSASAKQKNEQSDRGRGGVCLQATYADDLRAHRIILLPGNIASRASWEAIFS